MLKRLIIGAVLLHTFALAAYTVPAAWVPQRVRYWAQAYARGLYHQDWRLFAPDPPPCTCRLQVRSGNGDAWRDMADLHPHFIWRRMVANACRYAEASPRSPDGKDVIAPVPLIVSLRNMASGGAADTTSEFRVLREALVWNDTLERGKEAPLNIMTRKADG
jgi:hypothetical protein